MDKELVTKLDLILNEQGQTRADLAGLKADVKNLHDNLGEYKGRVNRIEARQWKISSFTAAVGAFIAYLFKK